MPEKMVSRQFSCSSFMSALNTMDAAKLLEVLPDDATQLASMLQDGSYLVHATIGNIGLQTYIL